MDNKKLRELAEEISEVIDKYGVDFEMVAVNITATKSYFEAVEDNLYSNVPIPMANMFTEIEEKWVINLIHPSH